MAEIDIDQYRRRRLGDLITLKYGGELSVFGRAIGYKDGAFVGQMLRGDRPISEKTVAKVQALPGALDWFSKPTSDGDTAPPSMARTSLRLVKDAPEGDTRVEPYLPGFEQLSIARLANSGSMGPGAELQDEVVVGRLTVSPQWASRTLTSLTKLQNLRFIHGYGDSMEPTFNDGDIMLVDAGIEEVKVDGIYVLEANERLYIKRVRQRMDGSFEISSDNPSVKTVDVLDGSKPVTVKGKIVWVWNGKRV